MAASRASLEGRRGLRGRRRVTWLPKHTRKFLLKSDPLASVFSQNGVRTSTFRATKTFLKHAPQRDTSMSYALPQSPSCIQIRVCQAHLRERVGLINIVVIFDGNERHERKAY